MKFNIGDKVEWESQAQGFKRKKEGIVVAIVPENVDPHHHIPHGFPYVQGFGFARNHESYLVQKGKSKWLYWPRVCHLIKTPRA